MELSKKIEPIILTQVVHTENNREKTAAILIGKLTKHSVIIRKGTTFLIIFSVLAFFAAVYLVHMESVVRHFQSPVAKTAAR
jgi:hypothetical protein